MVEKHGLFGAEEEGKKPNPKPGERAEGVRCPFARWWRDRKTETSFIRECRKCWACRMAAHDKILLSGLAETQVSGQVFFVTLTYADLPDGEAPSGAKRLDSKDIAVFVKYWKRKGITVRKICVGEYGKDTGRAHWHMILFVPLTKEVLVHKVQTVLGEKDGPEWLVEPLQKVEGGGLPFEVFEGKTSDFKIACDDPSRLVVQPPYQRDQKCHQLHESWKHGKSDWQLIYRVGKSDPVAVAGRLSYVVKYIQKDCWRDSKTFQDVPFELLPPYIQQMTNYGVWDQAPGSDPDDFRGADKWVRHNPVREQARELARDLRDGMEYLPIDEHPYVRVALYTHRKPPLGGHFFHLEGRRHAQQQIPSRKVVIGGYRQKLSAPQPYCMPGQSHASWARQVQKYMDKVKREGTAYSGKTKEFIQSDSQHAQYMAGYREQLEKMGKPPISGRDHSFDRLDAKLSRARRAREGAFFLGYIDRHPLKDVIAISRQLLDMGQDACKGLVSVDDWARVKLLADPAAPEVPTRFLQAVGEYEQAWQVGERSAVCLSGETLTHVGYLTDLKPWFEYVLETEADFERAIAGKLPSKPGAVANFDFREEVEPIDLDGAVRRLNQKALYFPKGV